MTASRGPAAVRRDRRSERASRFLERLRTLGAGRLRRVTFRRNRSTLWSLTRGGTALNLHEAYSDAPDEVVEDLAILARTGGQGGAEVRAAARRVRGWPPVLRAVRRLRRRAAVPAAGSRGVDCCGTEDQRRWLREAYRHLDRTRFGGSLPDGLRLRLSRRMRRSLGHLRRLPGGDGGREVEEIALNMDLFLPGNEALLRDTLLHEMAHAAAWIVDGDPGHGAAWKRWARRVGCRPRRCHTGRWRERADRRAPVRRVPPRSVFLSG